MAQGQRIILRRLREECRILKFEKETEFSRYTNRVVKYGNRSPSVFLDRKMNANTAMVTIRF